jgi:serine/threonine protein kinase
MRTEALTAPPGQRWCLSCRTPIENPSQVFCANCGTHLPDAPPLDGRYEIGDSLGEGGFGHTYLAQDTRTRKPVAIKRVPRRNLMGDRAMLTPQHFDRELKLLSELNTPGHPNIPEVLDTFSDDQADYLVMKYITGQTLKKKLEVNGPLPWETVGPILEQVLSALAYMKAQPEPVVHGDVKPNNLIEDETGRLFLVDFGMARRKSAGGNWATESDSVAGTPGFASWDLWRGGPSPASDTYALGMTAYVLMAGLESYDTLIDREHVSDQRFTPHPGLTMEILQRIDVSDVVRDMLCAATASEPRERPTADDWLNNLIGQRGRKNTGLVSASSFAQRPLYFPNGSAAQNELEFVALADKQLKIATEFLYQDDTLARWLEMQCFRADLAQVVREIREEYPDRHEAFEYTLQALDPNRHPPQLTFEPSLELNPSFFSRGGNGHYTLTNQGPGYARLTLASPIKGLKVEPKEVLLGPDESQVVSLSASANTLSKNKDLGGLTVTMQQLVEPYIQKWPITAKPAPWWFILREVILLLVIIALGLFIWSAVQNWLPCTLANGFAACPPPPLLPPALLAFFH